ncbi:MAG: hypothetical protein HOC71_10400 [Candidatus Latescibacteria bacterium]|jgi:hypothetical protein|nr:hypothetical protein [Candidatus Latescibacterota bacterium]
MKRIIIILFVFMFINTQAIYPTINANLSIEYLCSNSTSIIVAKVISLDSFYMNDTNAEDIYTSIKFEVMNSFKGDLKKDNIFEMVRCGGTIGEITRGQFGAPVFKKNQKVILFVKEYVSKIIGRNYSILGLSEGKFNLVDETVFRDYNIPLKNESKKELYNVTKKNPINKNNFYNLIRSYLQ